MLLFFYLFGVWVLNSLILSDVFSSLVKSVRNPLSLVDACLVCACVFMFGMLMK